MKPIPFSPTSRRLALAASLAMAGMAATAQAPAGTPENPTAPLNCWALPCPPGFACGPGSSNMTQILAFGLVNGGAYSPLAGDPLPNSPRQINNNLQVADLRSLAPLSLHDIRVSSAISTIYRGPNALSPVAQQLRSNFAPGSLPSVNQVAKFPLSPTKVGGDWLLTLDVSGTVPRKKLYGTFGSTVPANFSVACTLPVIVPSWTTQ